MPDIRDDVDPWEVVADPPPDETHHQCVGCGAEGETGFVNLSMGWVCENCVATCPDCGKQFNSESGRDHANVGDGLICARCTRDEYFWCNGCETWNSRDSMRYVECEGIQRCEYCIDSSYEYCDGCDQWHCRSCMENCESSGNGLIHDYSYKPVPNFLYVDNEVANAPRITQEVDRVMRTYAQVPFMGIELEVECEGGSSSLSDGVQVITDGESDNGVLYLKSDGSIHYGFEIVTHPMTLAWAMQHFPWSRLERLDQLGFTGWTNSTCGLHIHVSRDGFRNDSHQARFIHFIVRNSEFMEFFAGRKNSRWSSFTRDQLKDIKSKMKSHYPTERYLAVNTNNSGTLEVRIFKASLKPARVQMCMQLVNAIVLYTEGLRASDFIQGSGFHHSTFVDWVKEYHNDTHNVLVEYLNEWYEPFINGSQQIGE